MVMPMICLNMVNMVTVMTVMVHGRRNVNVRHGMLVDGTGSD